MKNEAEGEEERGRWMDEKRREQIREEEEIKR